MLEIQLKTKPKDHTTTDVFKIKILKEKVTVKAFVEHSSRMKRDYLGENYFTPTISNINIYIYINDKQYLLTRIQPNYAHDKRKWTKRVFNNWLKKFIKTTEEAGGVTAIEKHYSDTIKTHGQYAFHFLMSSPNYYQLDDFLISQPSLKFVDTSVNLDIASILRNCT